VIAGALFWTNNGKGLTPAQAFSTLSIIQLVSQPFSMLMMAFPILWSIAGCFTRIQNYLLLPEQVDQRSVVQNYSSSNRTATSKSDSNGHKDQLLNVTESEKGDEITIVGASFEFETTSEPVLKNVNINIPPSSFTTIIGEVGSGKTTLLRAILGEVEMCQGNVQVSHGSIAYCGQTSWLRNISIRANILGENPFDQGWYNTVMDACLLNEDIKELSEGDESLAGNGGSNLSGGQKQRVVCSL
jgi:ATP-binding cassette subfamily C (CFTR/MRP) protein 1